MYTWERKNPGPSIFCLCRLYWGGSGELGSCSLCNSGSAFQLLTPVIPCLPCLLFCGLVSLFGTGISALGTGFIFLESAGACSCVWLQGAGLGSLYFMSAQIK